jgi:hypothetical protein
MGTFMVNWLPEHQLEGEERKVFLGRNGRRETEVSRDGCDTLQTTAKGGTGEREDVKYGAQ